MVKQIDKEWVYGVVHLADANDFPFDHLVFDVEKLGRTLSGAVHCYGLEGKRASVTVVDDGRGVYNHDTLDYAVQADESFIRYQQHLSHQLQVEDPTQQLSIRLHTPAKAKEMYEFSDELGQTTIGWVVGTFGTPIAGLIQYKGQQHYVSGTLFRDGNSLANYSPLSLIVRERFQAWEWGSLRPKEHDGESLVYATIRYGRDERGPLQWHLFVGDKQEPYDTQVIPTTKGNTPLGAKVVGAHEGEIVWSRINRFQDARIGLGERLLLAFANWRGVGGKNHFIGDAEIDGEKYSGYGERLEITRW